MNGKSPVLRISPRSTTGGDLIRIALLVACLVFATVLYGCNPVVSVQPLYTQAEIEKPYLDQRLEGDWVMPTDDADKDDATVHPPCPVSILKSSAADVPYTVNFRCPGSKDDPGEKHSQYDLHLVLVGTATFFDARIAEFNVGEKSISLSDVAEKGIAPAHLLGEVWVQQDFVRFATLPSDWVEKNWPEDYLAKSKVDKYSGVDILTNPTPSLRELLSRHAASPDASRLPLYLCRAGVDCETRSGEDELSRTPDDKDVLASAVKFYAKRGNFARAIALQRHKIELDSDAAANQFELGRLLLLSRDFDGARRALVTAKEPSEVPSIKELMVESYFCQGNYAATVQAGKSLVAPSNLVSADPIILTYFALHRLGQAKKAESYLRDQAAAFAGPAQEQLLLLQVLGRVTDSWTFEDWARSTYYYALNSLKNGDLEGGRSHMQDLAKMQPKDSLIGLAAQLELDRLASSAKK
jgi:tetratricopeptide (TPR) repeat protein